MKHIGWSLVVVFSFALIPRSLLAQETPQPARLPAQESVSPRPMGPSPMEQNIDEVGNQV